MKVRTANFGVIKQGAVNQQKIASVGDSGLSQLGTALSTVGAEFEKAQIEVDETSAEEARLNFDRDITDILHNADTGYFNTSGKNAFDGQGGAEEAIQKAREVHQESLTPSQRRMFGGVADRMQNSNRQSIMRHASNGRKAWDIATQEASIENAFEKSSLNYQNDNEINVQLATMRVAVKSSSDSQGIGAEATQERLETMTSKFYGSVIGKALEDENIARANDLYKRAEKYLEPAELSLVKRGIKEADDKQFVMDTADSWFDSGLSVSEGLTKARDIKNPDRREAAENRFRHLKAIESQEDNRVEVEATETVLDKLTSGTAFSDIPTNEMRAMGYKGRIAAKSFEEKRLKSVEYLNDKANQEKYEVYADRAFSGEPWSKIEEDASSLPVKFREAIRTISLNREKLAKGEEASTQDELYEAYSVMIEVGGVKYEKLNDKAIGALTASQRSNLAVTSRRINPIVKPRQIDDWASVVDVEDMIMTGDFSSARDFVVMNPTLFKDATRKSYLDKLGKAIKSKDAGIDLKSISTVKQQIKNKIKLSMGKQTDKEIGEQALWVTEKYDEWSLDYQRNNKDKKMPSFDESIERVNKLVLQLGTDNWFTADEIEQASSFKEYEKNVDLMYINETKEKKLREISEIQTLNGTRRARGKTRLTESDVAVWKTEGKEIALRNVYIRDSVEATGLPRAIILRQVGQESKFSRNAKSYTNVKGMHQITKSTARDYGFDPDRVRSNNPEDEEYQWEAYSAIMADNMNVMGTTKGALLAYNAGQSNAKLMLAGKMPRSIKKNGKIIKTSKQVYREGLDYIKKIMGIQ